MTAFSNSGAIRNDFVHEPVPPESRRTWWRISSVWVGFIMVVGIMSIGGNMAGRMGVRQLVGDVALGNFLLGLLAAFSGYVAAKYRRSFAQMVAVLFPDVSGKIVLLYAPFTLVCWYSIECAIFGSLIGQIMHLSPFWSQVVMAFSAGVFCITTYIGFRGMQWLSVVLVPTAIVLGTYSVYYVLATGAGHFNFAPDHLDFNAGLGLVIGSWALGVVAAFPDIARFARTPAMGAWIGFIGILVFNSLNFFIGAAGAAYAQQYAPALILLAAGIPVLAVIMAVANVWTTNDANLYSASLGISRAFPLSRRPAVLICAAISVVFAFFNPAQFGTFSKFLGIVSNTAPALGGVVLGGYLLTRDGARKVPSIAGWLGWIAGSAASYATQGQGVVSVPAGFVVGFVVWFVVQGVLTLGRKQPAQAT